MQIFRLRGKAFENGNPFIRRFRSMENEAGALVGTVNENPRWASAVFATKSKNLHGRPYFPLPQPSLPCDPVKTTSDAAAARRSGRREGARHDWDYTLNGESEHSFAWYTVSVEGGGMRRIA